MVVNQRPTHKELTGKLRAARAWLASNQGQIVSPNKIRDDLTGLKINSTKELWPLVRVALEEITAEDYCGTRPPQKSYEDLSGGLEESAYCWVSQHFGKKMYLRFFMAKTGAFLFSSMHESREV